MVAAEHRRASWDTWLIATQATSQLSIGWQRWPPAPATTTRSAAITRRSAEFSALKMRYHLLNSDDQGDSDPTELAQIAEQLGRVDEAQGWAAIRDGKLDRQQLPREPLVPGGPSIEFVSSGGERHRRNACGPVLDRLRPTSTRRQVADTSPQIIPRYVDDLAESAGLHFVHDNAASSRKRPPETMSGGVGLIDYDRDGLLDVYAVQGGRLPPPVNALCEDQLYRNLGNGSFEDVSERAGLRRMPGGYGHGVTVGDYDNDARPDLFLTRWRSYLLLRNRPDGTFADVTAEVGLAGDRDWPTSAAWADLDGDGDLDLYVCHYVVFDLESPTVCGNAAGADQPLLQPARLPGASGPCLPQ